MKTKCNALFSFDVYYYLPFFFFFVGSEKYWQNERKALLNFGERKILQRNAVLQ